MTFGPFDCPSCGAWFDRIFQQKEHAEETGHVALEYCKNPRTSGPRSRHHCGRYKFHPGSCKTLVHGGDYTISWESPLQRAIRKVLMKEVATPTEVSAWAVAQAAYKFALALGYPVESDDWVVESTVENFRQIVEDDETEAQ